MLDTLILTPGIPEAGTETLKPEIRVIESEDTYGKVAVEPLPRGFGLTIGNPLRRILLSSTNGSAITWVKIDEVVHEYAAITGLKEEVKELLVNIKRIHFIHNTPIIIKSSFSVNYFSSFNTKRRRNI